MTLFFLDGKSNTEEEDTDTGTTGGETGTADTGITGGETGGACVVALLNTFLAPFKIPEAIEDGAGGATDTGATGEETGREVIAIGVLVDTGTWTGLGAVSYTHLTLPTILLV